jgi:hypothetical protein
MMEDLHVSFEVELDIKGHSTYHSLSAATAGGYVHAVRWLVEGSANSVHEIDRRSIVKEYAQTPVVIAARHLHSKVLGYCSSVRYSPRSTSCDYDTLTIALHDRNTGMIACLYRVGRRSSKNPIHP